MDEDLENLSRDALIAEVKRLRAGVRAQPALLWAAPALVPEVAKSSV